MGTKIGLSMSQSIDFEDYDDTASRLVKNFYSYLNSGRNEFHKIIDPIINSIVLAKDYFQYRYKDLGLPSESAYERIDPRRLPEKVISVYSLIKSSGKKFPQENINLSFPAFIDLDSLEYLLEEELPEIKPVTCKKTIEYYLDNKKILEIGKGLRRLIFFPDSKKIKGKINHIPNENALKILDLIYNEEPFIYDSPPSAGPTLEQRPGLRLITRPELRQEVMNLRNRNLLNKLYKANIMEVREMLRKFGFKK